MFEHFLTPLKIVIDWLDITKFIAIAGLLISLINAYFSLQARRLAKEQEVRRNPRLMPFLGHGYFRQEQAGSRTYAFFVRITNPTDSNNAISFVELSVTYVMQNRTQMTMKINANEPFAENFVRGQDQKLTVPTPVTAHNTVSGWIFFHIPKSMMADRNFESYNIVFTDSQNESFNLVPIIVQEYRDET